ncbi:nucleotidyl transferase AbiEii/AbiGii toxin family protein [Roseovarius sp. SYSU LYC5161]|uniref:nucleotidyl transferase AbiEii/AbiGii toxin family protein n=1 Tax=Roseovarius halophilus (ex Wu et al. 2025) TaxID=3376060 RepID=UPI00399BF066
MFDIAISIIEQANPGSDLNGNWTFGGGTALMLQISHRESHDIDMFIRDPQILPFLNPETQDYVLTTLPSNYSSDGSRSLKITFDGIGEIDFICCGLALDGHTARQQIRGVWVDLEIPAEIVTKKVIYRGARLQPRDLFDIAAVARSKGVEYLARPLSSFPDKVEIAQNVVERYQNQLLQPVLDSLNVKRGFESIRKKAQADTLKVLRTAQAITKP